MSRQPCEFCPLNGDFPREDQLLLLCGDQVPQCVSFLENLQARLAAGPRLKRIAELSRGGSLDLRLLERGDVCHLLGTYPGEPYESMENALQVIIVENAADGVVHAKILVDKLADLKNLGHPPFVEGQDLMIRGSLDSQGNEIGGFLHVGQDTI